MKAFLKIVLSLVFTPILGCASIEVRPITVGENIREINSTKIELVNINSAPLSLKNKFGEIAKKVEVKIQKGIECLNDKFKGLRQEDFMGDL